MKTSITYLPEFNEVTKKLPRHLHKFIVKQPYEYYTAQNQAVWRYVMRLNIDFLKSKAQGRYLEGLRKIGISENSIPKMEGMNRILKDIGWAAVAVDGFIPPNAFMEFQAYNVLVIASDIRTLEHIEYTPAPDIIHEAAGHAPLIANPEYARYLRRFGEIGCKAISSQKDGEIYEAVRHLSIIKEDPNTSIQEIEIAMLYLNELQENMGALSEMAQIRNLHWWTVEYGLIGTLENPKIYGAGLLSSIGESKTCLNKKVNKVAYSIEASKVNFDITKPQPQLFVTPNFSFLSDVLEEFADHMAFRKGGLEGVMKLVNSKKIGTVELNTGVQISGVFTHVVSRNGKTSYIQTSGKTALALRDTELVGHGVNYHSEGFGSALGKLQGIDLAIEDMSVQELEKHRIQEGERTMLFFEGGVIVEGTIVTGKRNWHGRIILISFVDCTVTYENEVLFKPEWGTYDMVVGKEIIAAYAGAASPESFNNFIKISKEETHKISYNNTEKKLHKLYREVRCLREYKTEGINKIKAIFNKSKEQYSNEWLLFLELYELTFRNDKILAKSIMNHLVDLQGDKKYGRLIEDGLRLLTISSNN